MLCLRVSVFITYGNMFLTTYLMSYRYINPLRPKDNRDNVPYLYENAPEVCIHVCMYVYMLINAFVSICYFSLIPRRIYIYNIMQI